MGIVAGTITLLLLIVWFIAVRRVRRNKSEPESKRNDAQSISAGRT